MSLQHLLSVAPEHRAASDIVDTALETVRRHLGMEVAYLSEFVGDQSVFRAVSAPGLEALIKPGDKRALEEVYCQHIVAGRLPKVIRDTGEQPLAMSLPITALLPIGSHVSVPVYRADKSVYGMFCCLSSQPNPTLSGRDLEVMELFANLCSEQVNASLADRARVNQITAVTNRAMEADGFSVLYQPIVDLATLAPLGFEALCRFSAQPYRSPDKWFTEASEVGLALRLESAVADYALNALDTLPERIFVSVNASPETVASGALRSVLAGRDLSRIVVEVTEQAIVGDYDRVARELDPLRAEGLSLAVDDAGAGYAGLQQILRLRPDKIKLDMSLTRDIQADHARSALTSALVEFARKTGAVLIAEGIETEAELAKLRELGLPQGQGFFLGRPGTLQEAVGKIDAGRFLAAVANSSDEDLNNSMHLVRGLGQ